MNPTVEAGINTLLGEQKGTKIDGVTNDGITTKVAITPPQPKADFKLYDNSKKSGPEQVANLLEKVQKAASQDGKSNMGKTLTPEERKNLSFIQMRVKNPAYIQQVFAFVNKNTTAMEKIRLRMSPEDAKALTRLDKEAKAYEKRYPNMKNGQTVRYVQSQTQQETIARIVAGHSAVDTISENNRLRKNAGAVPFKAAHPNYGILRQVFLPAFENDQALKNGEVPAPSAKNTKRKDPNALKLSAAPKPNW